MPLIAIANYSQMIDQETLLAKAKTARGKPAMRMALIRQWHVYISVFVAPSLLFFALTGALQTFRIPDEKTAPVVIQKLARLHKDDVFAMKPQKPKRPDQGGHGKAGPERPPEPKPAPAHATEIMKWFFTVVSLGIALTTLFGLWMALANGRNRLVLWLVLLAGALAPVAIAAL
jgi:hypothetical protein